MDGIALSKQSRQANQNLHKTRLFLWRILLLLRLLRVFSLFFFPCIMLIYGDARAGSYSKNGTGPVLFIGYIYSLYLPNCKGNNFSRGPFVIVDLIRWANRKWKKKNCTVYGCHIVYRKRDGQLNGEKRRDRWRVLLYAYGLAHTRPIKVYLRRANTVTLIKQACRWHHQSASSSSSSTRQRKWKANGDANATDPRKEGAFCRLFFHSVGRPISHLFLSLSMRVYSVYSMYSSGTRWNNRIDLYAFYSWTSSKKIEEELKSTFKSKKEKKRDTWHTLYI